MPKKVLFVFSGTGFMAQNIHDQYEGLTGFSNDVVRIYLSGCQESSIGGRSMKLGYVSPNLDTVAEKIKSSFDKDGVLSIEHLKKQLGSAVIVEPKDTEKVEVEDISLSGYSRGAVTTFAVARHLDELGKPIKIFAMDPVPGNSKAKAKEIGSEFYKNHDLRKCKNLVHSEVILCGYKKKVNPLHNKFYRQMAPLFPDTCTTAIYKAPKKDHFTFHASSENQFTDFLIAHKLKTESKFYVEDADSLTFVPKVIEQKHHIGTTGRTQLLPGYKQKLFDLVKRHPEITKDTSTKKAMAIYALDFVPEFTSMKALTKIIFEDNSENGKAIREFIVEFENITQLQFSNINDNKIKLAINSFRERVYNLLAAFPIGKATFEQKEEFSQKILTALKDIKQSIPKQYSDYKELIKEFLKENLIFHPDLTHYIDESETFNTKPSTFKNADSAMATLKTVKTGEELAEVLYYLSPNSRACAIDQFPDKIETIIKDAKQLGDVLRFLPAKSIGKLLENKKLMALIKTMDNLEGVIQKSFNWDQKLKIFNAMKTELNTLNPSFSQLGTLLQHVPDTQCLTIFTDINKHHIKPTSTDDLIAFFEKLNKSKFKQIFPAMKAILQTHLEKKDVRDNEKLRVYLQKRTTDSETSKVMDIIFPTARLFANVKKDFLNQVLTVQNKEDGTVKKFPK